METNGTLKLKGCNEKLDFIAHFNCLKVQLQSFSLGSCEIITQNRNKFEGNVLFD